MKKASKSAVADIRFEDGDIGPVELLTREQFAAEIQRLWQRANHSFLAIGRRLNEAKARLPHGDFGEMLSRDVPFSHGVANKLMRVATAIDTGVLPVQQLPPSYATIYELLTLTAEERERALSEGLLRIDLTRAEVSKFKARVRTLMDERAWLLARRDRLRAELQKIEERLNSLTGTSDA